MFCFCSGVGGGHTLQLKQFLGTYGAHPIHLPCFFDNLHAISSTALTKFIYIQIGFESIFLYHFT
jgi:hypothetical protein